MSRLLILEDDRATATALEEVARELGHDQISLTSPSTARCALQADLNFELIVADSILLRSLKLLPSVDAAGFCRIGAISTIVTAWPEILPGATNYAAGWDCLLFKPLDVQRARETIAYSLLYRDVMGMNRSGSQECSPDKRFAEIMMGLHGS